MNVLMYLYRYPGYGGIESVTTYISNYLSNKGYNLSIFSFISQDRDVLSSLLNKDIKIFHPNESYNEYETKEYLRSILIAEKIEVIIFQDSYAPVEKYLLDVISDSKIKLCTVEHNVPDCFIRGLKQDFSERIKWYPSKQWLSYLYWLYKFKYSIRIRHKLLYEKSDRYVLLSTKFYPVLKRIIGRIDESKLVSINNPITIKIPTANSFKKEKICLFCGRLTAQKGIKYLMDIWSEIECSNPEWKLVVLGDGPLKDFVISTIKKRNFKNITLVGFVSDPSEYYMKASILCMCSVFEGWMLSLVESMVYGCVPITFNSYESATDIISSGINGILIRPFDIQSYVQELQILMSNSDKLNEMSVHAINSTQQFSIDKIGNDWQKLLKSLNITVEC